MKVSIFTIFWSNDNEERLRNAIFTQKKLKTLRSFIQKNKIDCELTIFDFSEHQKINDSVHIPYDITKYDRSKKMNVALNYIKDNHNPDIICQFDSDVFITNDNFFNFLDLIKNIKNNQFFIANVLDIQKDSMNYVNFEKNLVEVNKVSVRNRTITGLGAFFMVHLNNLLDVGGFDERFEVWGGEDDDLADRLLRRGCQRFLCHFNFYHLYHEALSIGIEKNEKYQYQLQILKNDKTNIRPTLLNNYLKKEDSDIKSVDAIELLTPHRFDISAKVFYGKNRKFQCNFVDDLYSEHIRVWNNFFEQEPRKTSKEDFISSFNNLLDSIEKNGFENEKENYIPTKNKSPYNGAHRVASSIVNGNKLFYKEDDRNGQYECDYKFFINRGLNEIYLDEIALEYIRNKKNTYTITVFSSNQKDMSFAEKTIQKMSQIFYKKKIELSDIGKVNYVIELYRGEPWLGNYKNNYSGVHHKAQNCFNGSNEITVFFVESKSLDEMLKIKKTLREYYKQENHSVHINDTHDETWRISTTILNKNSLHYLNNFNQPKFDKFNNLFELYKIFMYQKNINLYCVTASSLLSLLNLRDCEDIDFLTLDDDNIYYKDGNINSHDNQLMYYKNKKKDIILNPINHLYWQGIKFANINEIYSMKKSRNEKKDLFDINLLNTIYEKKN
jgi:hypothetical protein